MSNKVKRIETNDVNVETGGRAKDELLTSNAEAENFVGECSWFSISSDDSVDEENFFQSQIQEKRIRFNNRPRTSGQFSLRSFYYYVMYQHWPEFCLSMSLFMTILTSIIHSHFAMKAPLMQRKAPSPGRFFPRNSPVTEFHDGNGFDLHKLLSMQADRRGSTGVLFVMYYAPWCARSMDAKWHMENLARYFYPDASVSEDNSENITLSTFAKVHSHGPVHFVAVNCWDPNGECRRSYKLYTYPVFLAYPGVTTGVYYNGVISADYMFRFLENVINPFMRVQNDDDIAETIHDYRTVAIAYFDFNQKRPDGYQAFYLASLKALERDPLRAATKFAIITHSSVATRLNFTKNGQIRLSRFMNETNLDFPADNEFTGKSISKWIFENIANPVRWVSPSTAGAGKSTALHEFLIRKPTLILFAPRQPLFDADSNYASLVNVALKYFDCTKENTLVQKYPSINETLARFYRRQQESLAQRQQLNELCLRKLREETRLLKDCCEDISNVVQSGQKSLYDYRQRNICHICYSDSTSSKQMDFLSLPSSSCNRFFTADDFANTMSPATIEFLTPIFSSRSCDRLINDFLPKSSVIDFCCRRVPHRPIVMERRRKLKKTRSVDNSGSAERVASPNCEKLQLSRLLRYVYERDDMEKVANTMLNSTWTGLACRTNRTLQFASMDSINYGIFARKMGLLHQKNATVIFDSQNEATYVLDSAISAENLGAFIVNFTYGRLKQFHRSEDEPLRHPIDHSTSVEDKKCTSGSVCIRHVTSSTFSSVVMDSEKDVLLFYSARWCGACQRLFNNYHTLAYYFRVVKDDIIFAQLDISNNDLPWQFTTDNVPSLIFFPAGRKGESAAFPSYAPWTLPNLVAFILAHCKHETRLRFALSTCIRNSTGDPSATVDTRCLIRNRYRTWRQLARVNRQIRFQRLEIERNTEVSKWDWDHDEQEWLVYLQRTWLDLRRLELKRRALRRLLHDALSGFHFNL